MDKYKTFAWSDANVENWKIALIWEKLEKLLSRTMKKNTTRYLKK